MRSLANYEAANKKLETAKLKNKAVTEAETNQQTCSSKFEKLSETGKQGVCACWGGGGIAEFRFTGAQTKISRNFVKLYYNW